MKFSETLVGAGGTSPFGRINPDSNVERFQQALGRLVMREKPSLVVETGVCDGYSTECILSALDANKKGELYSIDPAPSPFYLANPIIHPRWTMILQRSQDCLMALFEQIGLFDLFFHDSDHSKECQSFEYEFAWHHVRSGGIIATDDWDAGSPEDARTPPHNAWRYFCSKYGIAKPEPLGRAEFFIKP